VIADLSCTAKSRQEAENREEKLTEFLHVLNSLMVQKNMPI